jgi:hypothetical protein
MSETDGAKTGLASLVRRHPSFFFFRVGLSFFFFSYAAQWAPGVGVLPYALVYLGNAILILSGITFVYGRKKIGISPTSQPQLTVLFLTCWWTVTVTAISLGAGIPATFGHHRLRRALVCSRRLLVSKVQEQVAPTSTNPVSAPSSLGDAILAPAAK